MRTHVFQANRKYLLLTLGAVWLASCGATPQDYINRGNRFYANNKFDDAAIQFQKALQKSPQLGEAHYRLGLTELKRNHPVEAYRELQTASGLMSGNADVMVKLGQLSLSLFSADPRHPQQLFQQAN